MSIEHWLNDSAREKPMDPEKNIYKCHFVYRISHNGLESYPGLRGDNSLTHKLTYAICQFVLTSKPI